MLSSIIDGIFNLGRFIGDLFSELFNFLLLPLSYLLDFLIGIFYFVTVLFNVVVKVIMIFVALFQFIGAIILGFVRTLGSFLTAGIHQRTL